MRWEYKVIEFKKRSAWSGKVQIQELQSELDNLGRQGWELIQASLVSAQAFGQSPMLILKRPLQ